MSDSSLIIVVLMVVFVVGLLLWALVTDLRQPIPQRRKSDYKWPRDGAA